MENSTTMRRILAVCGVLAIAATALPGAATADPDADPVQERATFVSDLLPFAGNEVPITYPTVSLSFGIAPFVTSLSDVESALRAMEQAYRDAGFAIPQQAEVSFIPMVTSAATWHLSRFFDLALEIGRSPIKDDDIALVAGIALGRLPIAADGKVSLIAGGGAGAYRFKFKRSYGVTIPSPSTAGGSYTLENISLSGGGGYWTFAGGVDYRATRALAIAATVRYLGMNDVTTDTEEAGTINVNLGGVMVGASLAYFF